MGPKGLTKRICIETFKFWLIEQIIKVLTDRPAVLREDCRCDPSR